MIIIILYFRCLPLLWSHLSRVYYFLVYRSKDWKNGEFSSNRMNPKTPVVCICVSHVFASVRLGKGRTSCVSRSSQILSFNYSREITCTSWPIWNQRFAHCFSPNLCPVGIKATKSPWITLNKAVPSPFGKQQWFSCYLSMTKTTPLAIPLSTFSVTFNSLNF